jgi:hypothetical protein
MIVGYIDKFGWNYYFARKQNRRAKNGPTQRAADGGYAPRFLGIFLALSFSVSTARPPSHPPQLTHAVGCLLIK